MTTGPERNLDDRLADWVDGTLTERERERFVAELRVNAQLRQDLVDYEETVAAVRAALQAPTSPTKLADRVMAAIMAAEQQPKRASATWRAGPLTRRSILWSAASAAAVLCIAMLVNSWSQTPSVDRSASLDAKSRQVASGDDKSGSLDQLLGVGTVAPSREVVRESLKLEGGAANEVKDESVAVAAAQPVPTPASTAAPAESVPADKPATPPPTGAGAEPAPGAVVLHVGREEPKAATPVRLVGADPEDLATDDAAKDQAPRGGLPDNRKRDAAPGQWEADAGRAGGRRGEPAAAGELLPLVVLQGDALDALAAGKPGAAERRSSVPGAQSPAAVAPSAPAADARAGLLAGFDMFFTSQMRSVAPANADAATPELPSATLRLRALLADPAEPVGGGGGAVVESLEKEKRGALGADRGPIVRTWLVEGSKEEVALLLGRLAAFANAGNLHLTTGETRAAVAAPADVPVERAAPDNDAAKAAAAGLSVGRGATRLVLRFRVLRR